MDLCGGIVVAVTEPRPRPPDPGHPAPRLAVRRAGGAARAVARQLASAEQVTRPPQGCRGSGIRILNYLQDHF